MLRFGASGGLCAATGHDGASKGIRQGWLWKQAARGSKGGLIGGRKGGMASGVVRRAWTPLEHDRAPWAALGVSRRTWYRHFRGAKTDGESRWAKIGTEEPIQIDRSFRALALENI